MNLIAYRAKAASVLMCLSVLSACGYDAASTSKSQGIALPSEAAVRGAAQNAKTSANYAKDSIIVGVKMPQSSPTASTIKALTTSMESALKSQGFTVEQLYGSAPAPAKSSARTESAEIAKSREKDSTAQPIFKLNFSGMSVNEAIKKALDTGLVDFAEPNHSNKLNVIPNDPDFSQQWHHRNTGQLGGLSGFDIASVNAWNTTTGSNTQIVAVMDTGVYHTHPDLANNMWVNSGEIAGNGIDDDGDGFIDNVYGANTGSSNGNTLPNAAAIDPANVENHGTWVAGTIAATGNNGIGVSGVNWNAKIMAIKVADNSGLMFDSALISGFNFVKNKRLAGVNVKIINYSLGSYGYSESMKAAVKSVGDAGILVVSAAGNEGLDTTQARAYIGAYRLPNVINVAATDRTGNYAYYTNFGPDVDIAAPGSDIYTTSSTNTYSSVSGTSFASPVVAGIASLIWAANPSDSIAQIKQKIMARGVNGALATTGKSTTLRHASAERSVSSSCVGTPKILQPFSTLNHFTKGARHLVTMQVDNCTFMPNGTTPIEGYKINFGSTTVTLRDDGVYPDALANDGIYTNVFQPSSTGSLAYSGGRSAGGSVSSDVTGTLAVYEPINYSYARNTSFFSSIAYAQYKLNPSYYDDYAEQYTIPFNLNFYGASTDQLTISSNGRVCFGANITCSGYAGEEFFVKSPLPVGNKWNESVGMIAPWWADWDPSSNTSSTSGVFAAVYGVSPNRSLTVSWENVKPYGKPTAPTVSFQIKFYENQTYYDVLYGATTSDPTYSNGLNGVVGIQHFNGKIGTQLSYNTAGSLNTEGINSFRSYRWTPSSNSFNDTSTWSFITDFEGMKGSRITSGCGASNVNGYCPGDNVTRWMMAAFLERSVRGHDQIATPVYANPVNSPFLDVATNYFFYNYINAMREDGISTGWLVNGGSEYRPDNFVTREQMATFMVRALKGSSYSPPTCTGTVFNDVSCDSSLSRYVEDFSRMGITSGYNNGTEYRPNNNINRGEMAAFLQRAFRFFDYW